MKSNCKRFLLVTFFLVFFLGCKEVKEPIKDVYYKENQFEYSMRIVNNDLRMYFMIEKDKSRVLILNYAEDKLLNEIDIELSLPEIDNFNNFIKRETNISNTLTKHYKIDSRYSMTFFTNYGTDQMEVTFKGMQVRDMPIEMKEIILKMKKKNRFVKDFFDYEK